MKSENLDFDGMAGNGVNRAGNKWSGNQSGFTPKENYGTKTIRGNDSPCVDPLKTRKGVTKDPYQETIATARGGKINGGAAVKGFGNSDKINVGSK
jgi:hypothetical protein